MKRILCAKNQNFRTAFKWKFSQRKKKNHEKNSLKFNWKKKITTKKVLDSFSLYRGKSSDVESLDLN